MNRSRPSLQRYSVSTLEAFTYNNGEIQIISGVIQRLLDMS